MTLLACISPAAAETSGWTAGLSELKFPLLDLFRIEHIGEAHTGPEQADALAASGMNFDSRNQARPGVRRQK